MGRHWVSTGPEASRRAGEAAGASVEPGQRQANAWPPFDDHNHVRGTAGGSASHVPPCDRGVFCLCSDSRWACCCWASAPRLGRTRSMDLMETRVERWELWRVPQGL